jgi:hypothetical protein
MNEPDGQPRSDRDALTPSSVRPARHNLGSQADSASSIGASARAMAVPVGRLIDGHTSPSGAPHPSTVETTRLVVGDLQAGGPRSTPLSASRMTTAVDEGEGSARPPSARPQAPSSW